MNKVIPFILVVAFWGLFYLGNNTPGMGETIAILAVIVFALFVLYNIKAFLLNIIFKNK